MKVTRTNFLQQSIYINLSAVSELHWVRRITVNVIVQLGFQETGKCYQYFYVIEKTFIH